MTAGIVLGFVTGLTYGLLATGIVLIYKTNRFLNMAQAQFGALSALLLSKFVLDKGWSWWAAFPVVIAVGIGIGMLVERLVIRRMIRQKRNAVSMLLVSIGVAELLLAFNYVPSVGPDLTKLQLQGYPLPFESEVTVGSVVLGGADILTLILAPLLILALALFFRYSIWGKAIRACAANPDAARLCGIPLKRANALAWGMAGGLSAVTAVLQAPSQGTFNGATFGPDLLLRALGAAALGGFTSVPMALIGGLLIGEVEQITLSQSTSVGPSELVVFLLVVAIIFFRGRLIGVTAGSDSAQEQDSAPIVVPDSIKDRLVVRYQRLILAGGALFVAVLAPLLPSLRSDGRRFELIVILVMAVASVALTVLIGWAGQVSLGHYALLGLGAYMCAKLVAHDLSLPLIMVLAAAAGAAVMVLVGLPALRYQGLGLAVTTLGLAVVAPTWLFNQSWLGAPGNAPVNIAPAGVSPLGVFRSLLSLYYVALILLAVILVAAASLRRSLPGQLVIAVRDNAKAVASYGVSPTTIRLGVLAVSGAFVAIAGVVWGLAWQSMSTDLVPPQLSLVLLALPVIGGLGSLSGSVAGALAIYIPAFFISPHLTSVFGTFGRQIGFQLALAGAALVVIPLVSPGGLAAMGRSMWQRFLNTVARQVEARAPVAHADVPEPVEVPVTTAASGPPLRVRGVSKTFGGVTALNDVSVELRPGEIVGLIGPNGAGKTTLMNIISGHLPASAGVVELFGRSVEQLPADQRARLGLGRTFQEAKLFPGLTVREALRVALARNERPNMLSALLGAPWVRWGERRAERRVDDVIDEMGLRAWADTLTADLSTGTRRICELAAQVAAEPTVILLDEPTAGVAQREAEAFGPLLRDIRERLDCSVLIIEHDMPLLMGLCDRIYAMANGQVIACGTPDDVRADTAVVASYLGTSEAAVARSGATPRGSRARTAKVASSRGTS